MTTVLIAMPTQGDISTRTVKCLIGLTQRFRGAGIAFAFETYEFSDIVFSRNQLASRFLSEPRFTHMLMLDSDMIFTPEVILRLISFDAPFTAAPYPQKKMLWQRVRAEIERQATLPPDERTDMATILSANWLYNQQPGAFPGAAFTRRARDGFATVQATGTGMMCITREVVTRMVETGAARPLPRMGTLPLHKGLDYHDFFSHVTSPSGDLLYGEDQSFCYRWVVQCGGEIWLDSTARIGHEGRWTWEGRWADQLGRTEG